MSTTRQMFWALDHSPRSQREMHAFMEKRSPRWVPDEFA